MYIYRYSDESGKEEGKFNLIVIVEGFVLPGKTGKLKLKYNKSVEN